MAAGSTAEVPRTISITQAGRAADLAPVRWAAGRLAEALDRAGFTCIEKGGEIAIRIMAPSGEGLPACPDDADAFAIEPDGSGLIIRGRTMRGVVYALTEIAERVRLTDGTSDPLRFDAPVVEVPVGKVRSICRFFCSEEEDKAWFYDEEMWREYLTMLATNRFTRFSLGLGLQYNYPYYNRLITDVYFYFAYPFLVSVPGHDIRVEGLSDTERERNLNMLRFIGREAAKRGLDFQLALWTHGYDFDDVPRANYQIRGITPDNHAPYCRDALAALVAAVPDLTGVTVRVHVEAGIPEGSYDFWETVLSGLRHIGRPFSLDVHAKGTDQRMIDIALGTRLPVTVSPKFMAEHTGLPYHQASVRRREMPTTEKAGKIFALSEGSRRFLRYGYGDLFASDRQYDVVVRVWPGTQRVLLSADPALAAGYGRAATFCGASGIEFCEPLSFKGRMGSGRLGARFNYAPEAQRTRWDWSKYDYMYLLLGRLTFRPDAARESWMRWLRAEAGEAAEACETALAHATRVLPLVTQIHGVSACNNTYWPEIYDNMSIVYPPTHYPYAYDSDGATRFGDVPTFDPQLFANPEETVRGLWEGAAIAKYTTLDVACWLEACAEGADAGIRAAERTPAAARPAVRRFLVDARIQARLGRFFAARLRSAAAFELYLLAGGRAAYDETVRHYMAAREAWRAIVHAADGIYQDDLAYGPQPWLRGSWRDRLPAIERDIADLDFWYINDRDRPIIDQDKAERLLQRMNEWTDQPSLRVEDDLPDRFEPGRALAIRALPERSGYRSARLFYRRVNQAETWGSVEMERAGEAFSAAIPAEIAGIQFPLQYYIVFSNEHGQAFAPGLGNDLCGQPYFLAMPAP
jgi:hypothetical protein